MKDSQPRNAFDYTVGKYIKADNERFSTSPPWALLPE